MNQRHLDFTIVLVASTGAPHKRTRLYKLGTLIGKMGGEIEHWSWCRSDECVENDHRLPITKTVRLLKGGGNASKKLLLCYPLWMVEVFFYTLMKGRNRYLYCLNFESAFPVAVASLLVNTRFVFDHADNFSKSYPWPRLLRVVIEKMESFIVRRAALHVVPGRDRWQGSEDNTRILQNTPSTEMLKVARVLAARRGAPVGNRLTVYVNGWMGRTRGMPQLLEAVKPLGDYVHVIAAGRVTCAEAEELLTLPHVTFHGKLPNEEALALYFQSDLVLTYYDPAMEINRIAEPNKWGDCVMTETPFLTNAEVQTAKPFLEKEASIAVPYADVDGLREVLLDLARNPARLRAMRHNLVAFQDRIRPWDVGMRRILQEWLGLGECAAAASKSDP